MLTSFTRDDKMAANELIHQIELPIPAPVATMIIAEVGGPSFKSDLVTAWYLRAHWSLLKVPFALRVDKNGNWSTVVSMERAADLHHCFDHALPNMIEIQIIEPRGRNARAA